MRTLSIKYTEAYLSRVIKLLLFLIPFVPLYVSPSLVFPYITGKNFAFRVLVELAAVLWLVLVYINKKSWFRNSPMLIAVMSFALVVGVADLFGVDPYSSFWSNYERMEGYVTILHLLLYFIVLKNVFKQQKDWKFFFGLLVAVSLIVSIVAVMFPINEDPVAGLSRYAVEYGTRAHSTIGNPPFLASYLLLSIFVGIVLIINEKRQFLRYFFIAAVSLNSVGIYLTATRGAILGGIAGIVAFIFFYGIGRKRSEKRNFIKIVSLVTIIALAAVSIAFFVNDNGLIDQYSLVYRFKTMFSDPSVLTRLDVWKMAVNAIKERPLLGWGQENFSVVYTLNPIELTSEYVWLDRAHNIVIDWLVNAGILGLISYLSLFITAYYSLIKSFRNNTLKKAEFSILIAALSAYFIQNLFLFDTINTYIPFFAVLAYIDNYELFQKQATEERKVSIGEVKNKIRIISTLFTALLAFGLVFYYLNYRPVKHNRDTLKVSVLSNETLPFLSNDFSELLSYKTFGNADIRKRMLNLAKQVLRYGLLGHEGGAELVQLTAEELWKGAETERHNLDYFMDMINFFYEISVVNSEYIEPTEALIKECRRINPEFQWVYMAMADIQVLKKDYVAAFENVSKIAEEDPDNDIKQLKHAMAAILIEREDIVREKLEAVRSIRTLTDRNIALGKKPVLSIYEVKTIADNYMLIDDLRQALYYYREIFAMPEDYIKRMLKLRYKPWMAEVHHNVSKIYLSLGDEEKAAEEAGKASSLGLNAPSL